MIQAFDIMRVIHSKEPVPIEGAESLEDAIARVSVLREAVPGDYVIVSRITGKKILFNASGGIRRS